MEDLPDELLECVFRWLPFTIQVSILPRVCRRWYRVALGEGVIRRIKFTFSDHKQYNCDNRCMGHSLEICNLRFLLDPGVHELKYPLDRPISFPSNSVLCKFWYFLQHSDKIRPRHLELTFPPDFDTCTRRFNEVLEGPLVADGAWKYLSSLTLDSKVISDDMFFGLIMAKLLMKLISCLNLPNLTELKFNGIVDLDVVKIICFRLRKLNKLVLDKCLDLNDCLMFLSTNRLQHLRNLWIGRGSFTSSGLAKFLMVYSSQLNYFYHDDARYVVKYFGDEIYAAFAHCSKLRGVGYCVRNSYDLSCFPSELEELRLNPYKHLNKYVSLTFDHFTSLRHVCIKYFILNDESIMNLCRTNGRTLETFVLRDSYSENITSKSIDCIFEHCSQLVVLVMDYLPCDYCYLFFEKLIESSSCVLPRLHYLELLYCPFIHSSFEDKVSELSLIQSLAKLRPHLVHCWSSCFTPEPNMDDDSIRKRDKMKYKLWNLIGECHDKDHLLDDIMSEDLREFCHIFKFLSVNFLEYM